MNHLVIDNFLPYPDVVRTWALAQNFYDAKSMEELKKKPNTWPGIRTVQVTELDTMYADVVLSRISHIASTCFGISQNVEIRSSFQLCYENDGNSWVHTDHDTDIACLLYLTPNAPVDSGTIFYTNPPHEVMDTIGNVYNRLVMYRSNIFHKSSKYFGNNKENGRLTQVSFIKVI